MKTYILRKSDNCSDGGTTVGVYLNKFKCDKDLQELNKPRLDEELIYHECSDCRSNNCMEISDKFKLKDTCKRAVIKSDRNGEYCENDLSDWYSMKTDWYYVEETDVKE